MKELFTTDGYAILVDDSDYEYCRQFTWRVRRKNKHLTVFRNVTNGTKRLARELLNAPNGLLVDHRNRNGLDHQRHNLRLATYRQNAINRTKRQNTSSIYNGVFKSGDYYAAQIVIDKEKEYLGYFLSERHAAMAYDLAAKKAFGEFANLNFPEAIHYQAFN